MGNITSSDWRRCCDKLGLSVSISGGKGSHTIVRHPSYPDPSDTTGHITTIKDKLHKEANRTIFKQLLKFGIAEDNIWNALGML